MSSDIPVKWLILKGKMAYDRNSHSHQRLIFGGVHNCGSGGRWFESTQLYQDWLRKLATAIVRRLFAQNAWPTRP